NKTALHTDQTDAAVPDAKQYLQLVISASHDLLQKPRQEIIDLCLAEVRHALPASRDAQLVKGTVINEAMPPFPPLPRLLHFPPAIANKTLWPSPRGGVDRRRFAGKDGRRRPHRLARRRSRPPVCRHSRQISAARSRADRSLQALRLMWRPFS